MLTQKHQIILKKQEDVKIDLTLSVSMIAKKFGLVSTYETLDGHSNLTR